MNRVDRTPGVRLVTDHPSAHVTPPAPPVELPDTFDGDSRELVALAGRLNAGVGVQLLLDRASGDTFVTTVVAGNCLTFEVEHEECWDVYQHPGAYGLLPQL